MLRMAAPVIRVVLIALKGKWLPKRDVKPGG
jgi:hypothetical protein